jgi:TATA-box binding protein (TBP) (component of TFIID and TFIIIB)
MDATLDFSHLACTPLFGNLGASFWNGFGGADNQPTKEEDEANGGPSERTLDEGVAELADDVSTPETLSDRERPEHASSANTQHVDISPINLSWLFPSWRGHTRQKVARTAPVGVDEDDVSEVRGHIAEMTLRDAPPMPAPPMPAPPMPAAQPDAGRGAVPTAAAEKTVSVSPCDLSWLFSPSLGQPEQAPPLLFAPQVNPVPLQSATQANPVPVHPMPAGDRPCQAFAFSPIDMSLLSSPGPVQVAQVNPAPAEDWSHSYQQVDVPPCDLSALFPPGSTGPSPLQAIPIRPCDLPAAVAAPAKRPRGRPRKKPLLVDGVPASAPVGTRKRRLEDAVPSMMRDVSEVLTAESGTADMLKRAKQLEKDIQAILSAFDREKRAHEGAVPIEKDLHISTMTIDVDVDGPPILLDILCDKLDEPHVREFNQSCLGFQPELGDKKFQNAVIIKVSTVAVKVFHTKVKLHITGCKSVESVIGVANYFCHLFEKLVPGQKYRMRDFSVHLINTDMGFKSPVSLNELANTLEEANGRNPLAHWPTVPIVVKYEPEQHALLKFLYLGSNGRMTFVQIAGSGAVIISNSSKGGARSTISNSVSSVEFSDTLAFVFRLFAKYPNLWSQHRGRR